MAHKLEHLTRQADVIDSAVLGTPITVVGAGAVGSFTVLSLAKMGFGNITVYDNDTVDIENMNCQFYRFEDIGKPKVEALADLVKNFTGVEINTVNELAPPTLRPAGILVAAVDNMATRSSLWETNSNNGRLQAFIDPRMAVEEIAIRTVVPLTTRAQQYPASLYSDDDAVKERCTAKATMYTSLLISGLVCNTVKRVLCNAEYPTTQLFAIGMGDLVTTMEEL